MEKEEDQEKTPRDHCPICDGTGRVTVNEESGECTVTCPACKGRGYQEIINARPHWRMPRLRNSFPRGGGGRARMFRCRDVYSRGSEEPFFPGPQEADSRSSAAARQFTENLKESKDGKKEEDFDQAEEGPALQTSGPAAEPSVVASYEIPVDVFGEVEVNLEPGLPGPIELPCDGFEPSTDHVTGHGSYPLLDMQGSAIPPLAAELNYDITRPSSLGIPYAMGDEMLDPLQPPDGLI